MLLKVLVVDDDAPALELLGEVLRAHGAEVRPVSDAQQAAHLINGEKFDGIFLDLRMPKVDGFELTRLVRRSSWNQRTPIVVVTALDDKQVLTEAFEAGATFILRKPIDREKLTAVLDSARGAMADMVEERRRYKRVAVQTEIACQVGEQTLTGTSANLSQDGLLLQTATSLPRGSEVQLSFRLPEQELPVRAEGIVVRVDEEQRLGIGFTHISAEDRQRLRDLVIRLEPTA